MICRAFLTLLISSLLVAAGYGTSLVLIPLPELVARSDAIVAATVSEQFSNSCTITVSEIVLGAAPHEISVSHPYNKGIHGIFFLVQGKDQLDLVYPAALVLPEKLQYVRSLVKIRSSPRQYLTDPKLASTPEFLEMLGYLLRDREALDGISRQTAMNHLRASLGASDPKAVIATIGALRNLDRKDSEAVLPLLQHPDLDVRLDAIRYVGWAQDQVATAPLCKMLDGLKGGNSQEALEIGAALVKIGDSTAVPSLEQAIKRNVFGGTSGALAWLGNEASFEVLLEAVTQRESLNALDAVMDVLSRSNKPVEAWMKEPRWESSIGLTHKQDWINWWQENKADFKIIKTAKEAYGTE
ncbi:MAG: hypothetical protein QOE70_412 [Chthoniobacter sp.]|jgi:hypothetical protein|nr:hypothetical protein [Chthoniobacter sp.]